MRQSNWFNALLILATAFLAVFWAASFRGLRGLLGAQVDLLPPLMVYAAFCTNLPVILLLAVAGGLWFDSLSANPLGVTPLPLLVVGLLIHSRRELILREQTLAQIVLGFSAGAVVPLLSLALLLSAGENPLVGWGSLWQWTVLSLGAAAATPIVFELFGLLNRLFVHQRPVHSSFRSDREIHRGRR
jgi:cell shape-determining protein MreD